MVSATLPKAKGKARATQNPAIDQVVALETALLSDVYDPNPLIPLLKLSKHDSPEVVHKAIWALHRVFIRYIIDGKVAGISDKPNSKTGTNDLGVEREVEEVHEASEIRDGEVMEARKVKGWVRDRLLEYVDVLCRHMSHPEPALRKSSLPLLFSLLPPLSASLPSEHPTIHVPYFRMILRAFLNPPPPLTRDKTNGYVPENDGILPGDVVDNLQSEYWAKNDDLRWAFFKETAYLLRHEEILKQPSNLLGQLLPLTNLPRLAEDLNTFFLPSLGDSPSSIDGPSSTSKSKKPKSKRKTSSKADVDALPDWMEAYESESSDSDRGVGSKKRQRVSHLSTHAAIHSVSSHQAVYTTLWETVLSRVPLDDQWTRRILTGLHGSSGILGHMRPERRVRVADWLGSLVDKGGVLALLAMNGLFALMTKYNLDYPNFYQRLYGLLDEDVLHVKYRARFFRLLDSFLSSPLLPSAMIASFIKRLSSLSISAPPAGIIIIIPFIYNLFKRHPACMVMIQRQSTIDEEREDFYDPLDPSPFTSKAISTSCWELFALQSHYLASVSTLAKVFNETFTKPEYNLEDFLDHGYGTLFETEMKRTIKHPPAMSIVLESGGNVGDLFPGEDAPIEVRAAGGIVSSLWSFA